MRFVVRWTFRLFILLVVLGVALFLLKDSILKSLAENRIRAQTGLDVKIGKFEMDLLNPTLTIENFVLYNSVHFGGGPFITLRELRIEYDPNALALQRLHLKLVRLNLAEVNIVQDKTGRNNLQALQAELQSKSQAGAPVPLTFTGIDLLNLSLGKFTYMNLGQPNQTREVTIGLKNALVRNVNSVADLSGLLFKIMVQKVGQPWFNKT
ncbi:MAG: AsmA family protein [Candidatus Omnitrophica bacterium]|nr:AsmA family protein [Candidatus Omnitrophota bacterium]